MVSIPIPFCPHCKQPSPPKNLAQPFKDFYCPTCGKTKKVDWYDFGL